MLAIDTILKATRHRNNAYILNTPPLPTAQKHFLYLRFNKVTVYDHCHDVWGLNNVCVASTPPDDLYCADFISIAADNPYYLHSKILYEYKPAVLVFGGNLPYLDGDVVASGDDFTLYSYQNADKYTLYDEHGMVHWNNYRRGHTKYYVDDVSNYINKFAATQFSLGQIVSLCEICCGDGLWLNHVRNVEFGTDSDPTAITIAKRLLNDKEIRLLELDAHRTLPLLDSNRMWGIMLLDAFEHLHQGPQFLKVLSSMPHVKHVFLLNPVPNNSKFHPREYTHSELEQLWVAHGWKTLYAKEYKHAPGYHKKFFHFEKGA